MNDTTGAGAELGIPATMVSQPDGAILLEHCNQQCEVSGRIASRELRNCAVCQEAFGAKAVRLPCRHYFHKECVAPWLRKSSTCPLCRHPIPPPSVDDQAFWRQEFKLADQICERECEVD